MASLVDPVSVAPSRPRSSHKDFVDVSRPVAIMRTEQDYKPFEFKVAAVSEPTPRLRKPDEISIGHHTDSTVKRTETPPLTPVRSERVILRNSSTTISASRVRVAAAPDSGPSGRPPVAQRPRKLALIFTMDSLESYVAQSKKVGRFSGASSPMASSDGGIRLLGWRFWGNHDSEVAGGRPEERPERRL